jgi:hypothetical protein
VPTDTPPLTGEQDLEESRALLEGGINLPSLAEAKGMGFFAVLQRLRDLTKCPDCGKSTAVFNANGKRRGFKAESVTPESHCGCPPRDGRPAGPAFNPSLPNG